MRSIPDRSARLGPEHQPERPSVPAADAAASSSRSAARERLSAGEVICWATALARMAYCGVRITRRSAMRESRVDSEKRLVVEELLPVLPVGLGHQSRRLDVCAQFRWNSHSYSHTMTSAQQLPRDGNTGFGVATTAIGGEDELHRHNLTRDDAPRPRGVRSLVYPVLGSGMPSLVENSASSCAESPSETTDRANSASVRYASVTAQRLTPRGIAYR